MLPKRSVESTLGNIMSVIWKAFLSNGDTVEGKTDDGSWNNVRYKLLNDGTKIKSLEIHNNIGSGRIDDNCDGYLIGNKAVAIMPSDTNIVLVGIGYWKQNESVARIKWYRADSMELVFTEARPINECGFFLIKNNG